MLSVRIIRSFHSTMLNDLLMDHQHHRQMKDAGEQAKDVVIYILAGAGVLVGILLFTYLSTMFVDWLSKRLDPNTTSSNVPTRFEQHDAAMAAAAAAAFVAANVPDGRSIEDYDRGSMARQANLWGLETTERELILQKIFPILSFEYNVNELPKNVSMNRNHSGNVPVVPTDIEMSNMSTTTNGTDKTSITEVDEAIATTIEDGNHETGDAVPNKNETDGTTIQQADDTDHYRMCSICLSPYEPGVRVMTGVQCQHMFHEACCQQWLLKHDHCPFCRKNMIWATDFRIAAMETLSPDRITALSVIPTTTRRTPPPPPSSNRIFVLSN